MITPAPYPRQQPPYTMCAYNATRCSSIFMHFSTYASSHSSFSRALTKRNPLSHNILLPENGRPKHTALSKKFVSRKDHQDHQDQQSSECVRLFSTALSGSPLLIFHMSPDESKSLYHRFRLTLQSCFYLMFTCFCFGKQVHI